jgi:starch phosphorylase
VVNLPDRIKRLDELAHDLWWAWTLDVRKVFRTLDYPLWRLTQHNPVRMLKLISHDTLEAAVRNPLWLAAYDRAVEGLEVERSPRGTWCAEAHPDVARGSIAYFSAEFALHQSLPIYAGGLGVLAGDHCKAASDLGVPLLGIGFMYPQGYFHQTLTADGWQEEVYEKLDWTDAPVEPALTPEGRPCVVAVPLGQRTVLAAVWRVRVGRVSLYLLDTGLEENAPDDRDLSARLYGGTRETRLQQEIVLGMGGVRVLKAMGLTPAVYHLNEGHAAFVSLQRIHDLCEQGAGFGEALETVRRSTVFTTHTPVPAGHDAFPLEMVEAQLAGAWGQLAAHRTRFLDLGRHDSGHGELFNMTALALRTAAHVNGVSQLHGRVTREMWRDIWPGTPVEQVPVAAVTNGVHVGTWLAASMVRLFERSLDADWMARHDDPAVAERVDAIPDAELWAVRQELRAILFKFLRERARKLWTTENVSAARIVAAGTMFDEHTLTIGFARRFTAYKRPDLIFSDPERLARILNAHGRPVQLVFAGKAHPADETGKHHLQHIYRRALDPQFGGRIAFIDDYDLHVAHYMVQGCDVWLNNPRKPLEASGTSGMKAAINGTPNLSIGDGWWAEGFTGDNGWLIDGGTHEDSGAQDWADAQSLYQVLEERLVPAYYARDEHDVPVEWLRIVRQAIRTALPRFSTRRMVKEYVRDLYDAAMRAPGAQAAAD